MRTWMIAILGLVAGGLAGAVFVARSSAQAAGHELESVRHPAVDTPLVQLDPGTLVQLDPGTVERIPDALPARLLQTRSSPIFISHGQPGTWQIVTAKDMVLLLNSATGATFRLVQDGEGVRWQAIEGQHPKSAALPAAEARRIEWPDTGRRIPLPPEVDRPAVRDLREMEELVRSFDNLINSLEARLKKETGEAEKAKIEGRLTDLRADRKKAAEELAKAKSADTEERYPAPRGR